MLWDLLLFFVGLGLAAVGLVNPATSAEWFALAALCALAIVSREVGSRRALLRKAFTERMQRLHTKPDGIPNWAKGGEPFVDFMDTPLARQAIKFDAVFAPMSAARMERAKVRTWVILCEELGREPSKVQLETAAKSLC